jgi:hypothetical protein
MFRNLIIFYVEELLAPRPTPKLEDHPLLAVRNCLFMYSRTTVSADSVSAVLVIRGLLRTDVRFKYLRLNLPASTLVDLKLTCIGFATIRGFGYPR